MALRDHYRALHKAAIPIVRKEGFSLDIELDNLMDQRRGLTLLLRPNEQIKKAFQKFIFKAQKICPEQYFYPSSDIHVTVMPIISCYDGFSMERMDLDIYDSLIQNALKGVNKIHLSFEGMFASPSCLIVKGYPLNDALDRFRQNLRDIFSASDVEQSLDKRYKLITAHSTVVRFKKPVHMVDSLLELVEEFSNHNFGQQLFDQVEFVYNDWYQRKSLVQSLKSYNLPL